MSGFKGAKSIVYAFVTMTALGCSSATSQTSSSEPQKCANPTGNDCTFYSSCIDAKVPCGTSGYALGFGQVYCDKFFALKPKLSAAGQDWVDSTAQCLQRALVWLEFDSQATCDQISMVAFDSHPGCYTQPGQSFCQLPLSDQLAVLGIINPQDIPQGQVAELTAICTAQNVSGNAS
jgi:hypothetical protein